MNKQLVAKTSEMYQEHSRLLARIINFKTMELK